MKNDQPKRHNGKQSPKKLTFIFILLPILVVALMVVFWIIFKATRKQVQTDVNSHSNVIAQVQKTHDLSPNQFERILINHKRLG